MYITRNEMYVRNNQIVAKKKKKKHTLQQIQIQI